MICGRLLLVKLGATDNSIKELIKMMFLTKHRFVCGRPSDFGLKFCEGCRVSMVLI